LFVANEAFVAAGDALFVADEALVAAGDALFAADEAFVAAGDAFLAARDAFVANRFDRATTIEEFSVQNAVVFELPWARAALIVSRSGDTTAACVP
jgi:hypothetical protein